MEVKKCDFIAGAAEARGTVVVIDVFRAFSVVCYLLHQGAERIYPEGEIAEALDLSKKIEDSVLVGERHGKRLQGFDFGNSPTEVADHDFSGKTIIHTTHSGTQGLVNARFADELLTGAFVNAQATARYIQDKAPKLVTLVRMGLNAKMASDEDNLCAEYLESLLLKKDFDVERIRKKLIKSSFAERFFDPEKPWNPPSDFEMCVDANVFDFAVGSARDEYGRLFLAKREHGQTTSLTSDDNPV